MPSVYCPECDDRVKYQDDGRAFVRCEGCGYKIRLDEDDDEEDDRPRKKKPKKKKTLAPAKKTKGGTFLQRYGEVLANYAVLLLIGFVLMLLSFFVRPQGSIVTAVVGWLISIYGFVRTSMLATKEGNYISADYLESLGGLRWLLIFFFFSLYVSGYFILWYIVHVGCAIGKPKIFVPWIGIQVFGMLLMIAGFIAGAAGASVFAAMR